MEKYCNTIPSPSFKTIDTQFCIGQSQMMSLAADTTFALFRSFMPRRKEVLQRIGSAVFCIRRYPSQYDFGRYQPQAIFEKWAAVPVPHFENAPLGMQQITLIGGFYAVFTYQGTREQGLQIFTYIFRDWLPTSGYNIDPHRAHFDILSEKYQQQQPDGEEQIWIPLLPKNV